MENNNLKEIVKTSDNTDTYKTPLKEDGGDIISNNGISESPFLLENKQQYKAWRAEKLSRYPVNLESFIVPIDSLDRITPVEKDAILDRCKNYNMAIYQLNNPQCDPELLKAFASNFGLENLDQHFCNDNNGITALRVSSENNKGGFIPYSDKAISWHTDGYYNSVEQQVYAILLHCHTPASEGGENYVMDHEMAYISLRDENPAYIKALMHEDAMTIPAHIEEGKLLREEQSGPVFSVHKNGKRLHMRFSQRKRYITWRDDSILKEAILFLNHLLNTDKRDMLHIKLKKGQGILCNNILHNRSAFKDTEKQSRLIYRGRFFDPIV